MGSGGSKHKPTGSRAYGQNEKPSPPGKPYLYTGLESDPDVITIRWEQPIFKGGSKITGYVVEHKRTGSPHWVKATPIIVRHTQLSLSGLEPGMRYQFRVCAENAYGRSEYSELSEPLAISYGRSGVSIAPVFSQGLCDTGGIENEKVEFLVRVEGTPFPKISWYKDGFEVFSNRRQKVSTDRDISTFVIHQAALTDEGEIKCTATNKAGHAVTKARLTLEAPPSIRLPRQYEDGLLFELGEIMRLKILVTGRPQPTITWLHNGEEISSNSRIDVTTTDKYAMVKISEARREDRGEYQIKAKNNIGDDIASFLVTITDRPLPPGKVNVVMTLGRCVTLGWTAPSDDGGCKIGNYIVEYYRIGWDMWLKAATCRQLTTTIGDLIEGSEYKFRVKAENPYGISDPSEDSDIVFIPDPKRGLLEPPAKGKKMEIPDWLERKTQIEKRNKPQVTKKETNWDEDESPIPSQVILANQVLRKVKLAPQRTWSEDSQGSPPREPSPKPTPVPPKRKNRERMRKISEEGDFKSYWDSNKYADDLHSSSEMMLVLVGNSRATTEDRDFEPRLTADDLKEAVYIAPPISLSAPVLGGDEPFDARKPWGSSSDLMYLKALQRFNKEIDDEEIEAKVKRKYGIERKRSFEKPKKQEKTVERIPSLEEIEKPKYDEFSERFMMLERSFKDYSSKYEFESPISDLEESVERSFDYTEDEVEETYHPRLGLGTFTPISFPQSPKIHEKSPEKPKSPSPLKENSPEKIEEKFSITVIEARKSPSPVPTITLNERPENINETPKIERKRFSMPEIKEKEISKRNTVHEDRSFRDVRSRTPSPQNVVLRKKSPSPYKEKKAKIPKPILKVRDKSLDRSDVSDSEHGHKKVRIEAPEDKRNIDRFAQEENDVGLHAGEVARNRRKHRSHTDDDMTIVVSHYSDIVKEYGQNKKPPAKLYLSYEELKAAADQVQEVMSTPTKETDEKQEIKEEPQIIQTQITRKKNLFMEYLLDVFLFLIACWLYIFKDPRLVIPLLILMIYRQLSESLQRKLTFRWGKKDPTE